MNADIVVSARFMEYIEGLSQLIRWQDFITSSASIKTLRRTVTKSPEKEFQNDLIHFLLRKLSLIIETLFYLLQGGTSRSHSSRRRDRGSPTASPIIKKIHGTQFFSIYYGHCNLTRISIEENVVQRIITIKGLIYFIEAGAYKYGLDARIKKCISEALKNSS